MTPMVLMVLMTVWSLRMGACEWTPFMGSHSRVRAECCGCTPCMRLCSRQDPIITAGTAGMHVPK